MGAPTLSDHRQAELIAKELAFEAMKWLLRCGGDATRLSELGRAALAAEGWQQWLQKSLRRRGTTMRALAETDDEDFRGRLDAVQAAIDAYLQAKIARRSGREGVMPG